MKTIKPYLGAILTCLIFICSPFWNNFLNEDNSRMTFSYWLHWGIIYGGGALILWAFGYCFWGGVQFRINKSKRKYDKEIENLLGMNKSLGNEIKSLQYEINNTGKKPIYDLMATPNYLKANCPKCKNKIEFLEKDINETLHCDSCGIDFRYEQI